MPVVIKENYLMERKESPEHYLAKIIFLVCEKDGVCTLYK